MKSQDNLFLPYRLRDLWYEAQKNQRNMQKKKNRSFRLGRHGHIEGFQTSACLRSYLESLYPTRDV
jgi:hypothetical protein